MFVVELTNKGADHVLKCLLTYIAKVEVEVEEWLRGWYSINKIPNNSRAKNRLATSRNPIEP